MEPAIESTANPLVRRLSRLGSGRARREEGSFLVEGRRAIDAFLAAGWLPRNLLLRRDLALPESWAPCAVRRMSTAVAERIARGASASGFIAEFAIPPFVAVDPALGGLILSGIADPGNLGTLVRSAAAFGVIQVVLRGGVDPWNPKVVQASAGTLARVRLAVAEDQDALRRLAAGAPLLGLVAAGGRIAALRRGGPCWLLVGSEAHGLAAEELACCCELLTLPMPGQVESLNAAVAGSIACFLVQGLDRGVFGPPS